MKTFIEYSSGFSLDEVRVHYNSEKPAEIGALAYAEGLNVYIASGQEKHLAHELWHVVQQMRGQVKETKEVNGQKVNDNKNLEAKADIVGRKNPISTPTNKEATNLVKTPPITTTIQRYVDNKVGKDSFRLGEDLSVAVGAGAYPNHLLYAKRGKTDQANKKLQAVKSGIELEEQSRTIEIALNGKKQELVQVLPKNKQNKTEGENMKLWADCGKSSGVVMGGQNRQAVYNDPAKGSVVKTKVGNPDAMKAEIMKKLYEDWLTKPDKEVSTIEKAAIKKVLERHKIYDKMADDYFSKAYKHKSDAKKYEELLEPFYTVLDLQREAMMEYYESLPLSKREQVDNQLKINKASDPETGQGYTMSSGGKDYPGESTWNFHWAGVIMETDDKKDNITLENYATGILTEQNKDWDVEMYGTKKTGQTFHEQHKNSKLHGTIPITMTAENK